MSETAPKENNEKELTLTTLVHASTLVSVQLVSANASRPFGDNRRAELSAFPDADLTFNFEVFTPQPLLAAGGGFIVGASVRWHDKQKVELAKVEVSLRLGYTFQGLEMERVPNDVASSFGSELAVHHAWPFLRERVHSLSIHLGVPPVVLPLHRPNLAGARTERRVVK